MGETTTMKTKLRLNGLKQDIEFEKTTELSIATSENRFTTLFINNERQSKPDIHTQTEMTLSEAKQLRDELDQFIDRNTQD